MKDLRESTWATSTGSRHSFLHSRHLSHTLSRRFRSHLLHTQHSHPVYQRLLKAIYLNHSKMSLHTSFSVQLALLSVSIRSSIALHTSLLWESTTLIGSSRMALVRPYLLFENLSNSPMTQSRKRKA